MSDEARFDVALARVSALLRGDPNVLMVADDDDGGNMRILVVLKTGTARPVALPESMGGFPIVVEWTEDIVAHEPRHRRHTPLVDAAEVREKMDVGRNVLAFATDGTASQLLGIGVVLRALSIQPLLPIARYASVRIAAPADQREVAEAAALGAWPRVDVTLFQAHTSTHDRYFAQLALVDIFAQSDPSDILLCLDYDHVLVEPHLLRLELPRGAVLVSSEMRHRDDRPPLGALFGQRRDLSQLNVSLLLGRADALSRVGRGWHAAYEEISAFCPARHRTEVAFGLAALRSGSQITPCPVSLQGNFANPNARCGLFHYGGESAIAGDMKALLAAHAQELGGRLASFAELDQTTAALTAKLRAHVEARGE